MLGFAADDGYREREALVRLPLLIRVPGGAAQARAEATGHVDIAPTILGLLGVRDSERDAAMLGGDLTRASDPLVVFRDGSFTNARHLLVNRPVAGDAKCYEIRTGEPVDCRPLEPLRRRALDRLLISDNIVR